MKKRLNKTKTLTWALIILLIIVLYMMARIERTAPGSTIKNPWDAFWYFLVTITTVGYGDVSPVTPFGRALGVIFVLLSCGLISVLITTAISFMNGSFILRIRIMTARADKWYIFGSDTPGARCLAAEINDSQENAGIIFCETERQLTGFLTFMHIFTPLTVLETAIICSKIAMRRNKELPCIFLTSDDDERNLTTALEILSRGKIAEVYCKNSIRFNVPPEGLHTFDIAELTARTYWANYPLTPREKNVVLIGSGANLNYLIEQAILVNTFGPLCRCCYHIFSEKGDSKAAGMRSVEKGFMADHPRIGDVITVKSDEPGALACVTDAEIAANDILFFHSEHWNTDHSCLAHADRIIICCSRDINNIMIAEKIRLLVATKADIHVCGSGSIDGVTGFGSLKEIYTTELILKDELLKRAHALNDYYNSMQTDDSKRSGWENLSTFTRRSNVAAADHMGTKLRILTGNLENSDPIPADTANVTLALKNFNDHVVDRELCRRIEHERWMRFHSLYGWSYGPVRDNEMRKHPLMVPYEDLTPEDQALDDISWELLETLICI